MATVIKLEDRLEPKLSFKILKDKKCSNCFFYEEAVCKRFPEFISKREGDWCGEYLQY